jgi:hypothetical protein
MMARERVGRRDMADRLVGWVGVGWVGVLERRSSIVVKSLIKIV